MQKFRVIILISIIASIAFSCSKDKKEVEPISCTYLGKSYKVNYSQSLEDEHNSDLTLDEKGLLTSANTTYISISTDPQTNIEFNRSTNQRKYALTYDGQGFLKQMIATKSFIVKTTGGYYEGNSGPFKNASKITVETTDFTYESDRVASSSLKSITTFIGDQQSPVETTVTIKRVYQYDSNGKAISSIETFDGGGTSVTTYANGIRASNVLTNTNGNKQTINYNDKGLAIAHISSNGTFNVGYDTNGNMISVESLVNNKALYKQEFKYDDHPNPDNLIPSKFKGIPDPIPTIQSTDGVNNLVEEKTTNFQNNNLVSVNKFSYQYNAAGYPESLTSMPDPNPDKLSWTTNFRYQNCK
jgi:YD repeat-containing protein